MARLKDRDDNEFSGRAPYGDAKVVTSKEDFDRNRDGLYGGLPKTRSKDAEGPAPKGAHPPKKKPSR